MSGPTKADPTPGAAALPPAAPAAFPPKVVRFDDVIRELEILAGLSEALDGPAGVEARNISERARLLMHVLRGQFARDMAAPRALPSQRP